MTNDNCEICKKPLKYADGVVKEGVVEFGLMAFCSEECYCLWRTRND